LLFGLHCEDKWFSLCRNGTPSAELIELRVRSDSLTFEHGIAVTLL
jgi:hypothetical protein